MAGETELEAPSGRDHTAWVVGEHCPSAPHSQVCCCLSPVAVTSCSPLQTFFPETTDIYDKKNMPRVVYCLHALRWGAPNACHPGSRGRAQPTRTARNAAAGRVGAGLGEGSGQWGCAQTPVRAWGGAG